MPRSDQILCIAFFVASLVSMWGVLYAFWSSFEAFPVDSRVWNMDLDKICTLSNALLAVVPKNDSVFVFLRSVDRVNVTTLVGDRSSFHECTLLDTLVYLHSADGGLCLAFSSKAQADAFVASIGFKDLIECSNDECDDNQNDDPEGSKFEGNDFEDTDFEGSDTEWSGRGTPTT